MRIIFIATMLALTSCQNVSDVIKDLNTKIDNFGTSKRENAAGGVYIGYFPDAATDLAQNNCQQYGKNAVMISQGKDGTYSFACR